jgi:hypothetical protein
LTDECRHLAEERISLETRARVQLVDSESLQHAIYLIRLKHNPPKRALGTQIQIPGKKVAVNTSVTCLALQNSVVQAPDDFLDRELPVGRRRPGLSPLSNVRPPAVPQYDALTVLDDDLSDLISGLNIRASKKD